MVAVKQFFDAAESQGRDVKVRRAQLRIVSPALEALGDMPAHVQTVAAAILKQIDDRAFRPIATATTLQEASEQATKAFNIFANLWPTLLGDLIPWMQENPERFATMRHVATDVWTSTEAGRLGEVACSWFAAAQDARVALANAMMKESVPATNEATIAHLVVLADFALGFGLFLAHEESMTAVPKLPVTMAKLAYEAAKEAYVLATTHRFADPDPPARE